ncbi:MAG: hypothetical protein Wins2KO_22290 [Winogradskyella sp.]
MMEGQKYPLSTIVYKPWMKIYNKDGSITVKIPTLAFMYFLNEIGFFQTFVNGYFQIVRLENNIISTVEDYSDIIEVATKWLDGIADGDMIEDIYVDQVKSAWINKTTQLFSNTNLRFLKRLIVNECKDTVDSSFFFFKNKAIKVTKKTMEEIEYQNLPGHVFTEEIIDRNINLKKITKLFKNTPYASFIHKISNKVPHRTKSFMTAAGYLMHRHKNPATAKAVILYDEPINELNQAFGGSGKTQYGVSISHMRPLYEISGKDFTSSYAFKWQGVTRLTRVVMLNDIQPNLKFDDLYNVLSDDMPINIKFKPEFIIKFKDSPKFLLASNHIIRAPEGHSTERRKYEIELSTYYGKERTIESDFNHLFFYDWDEEQWNKFFIYMMQCVQYYLNFGLIEPPTINLNERRLIIEVGIELIEFLDEKFAEKPKHHKKELFKEFVTGGYVNNRRKPTQRSFILRLNKYLKYKGVDYRETPSNTKAYVEIIREDDPIHFITIEDIDTDYRTVDSPNKITRMVNTLTKHYEQDENCVLALDFETTGTDPLCDEPVSLALSFKPKAGYNIILPDNPSKRNKLLKPLLPFLHDEGITKVFHNAKFDLKFMWKLGIQLNGNVHDTMVMDYLYDPTTKSHGLKKTSKRHLNYQMITFDQMIGDKSITDVDTKQLTDYAVEDSDITLQLYHFLTDKLQ